MLSSKQSVYQGLTPQLSLIGIMATHGCFKGIAAIKPFMVSYWDLKERLSMNLLFDDLCHLEQEFIKTFEHLLDPATEFELVIT